MQKPALILLTSCLLLIANTGLGANKADMYYQSAIRLLGSGTLEEVFELYARSAELGHPVAQYNLAMMYSNGESVYVDYQQAVYWFKKSTEQKFPPAQYRLGEMYYFEKGGLPRDLNEAVTLFVKAANQDDPDAQMNLAMLYGSGEGLAHDSEKALLWIKRSGEGGNVYARDYQDMLLRSHDGKFTAEQQHRYWIEKAAELGIIEALEELRAMIDNSDANP